MRDRDACVRGRRTRGAPLRSLKHKERGCVERFANHHQNLTKTLVPRLKRGARVSGWGLAIWHNFQLCKGHFGSSFFRAIFVFFKAIFVSIEANVFRNRHAAPPSLIQLELPVKLRMRGLPKDFRLTASIRADILRYVKERLDAVLVDSDPAIRLLQLSYHGSLKGAPHDIAMVARIECAKDVADFAIEYFLDLLVTLGRGIAGYLRRLDDAFGKVKLKFLSYELAAVTDERTGTPTTARPTPRPTRHPTVRPTARPSRPPTPRPTRRPTPGPTAPPTPGPTPTPRPTARRVLAAHHVLLRLLDVEEVDGQVYRIPRAVREAIYEFARAFLFKHLQDLRGEVGRRRLQGEPAGLEVVSVDFPGWLPHEPHALPLLVTVRGPADLSDFALSLILRAIRDNERKITRFLRALEDPERNGDPLRIVTLRAGEYEPNDILPKTLSPSATPTPPVEKPKKVKEPKDSKGMPWWIWLLVALFVVSVSLWALSYHLRSSKDKDGNKEGIVKDDGVNYIWFKPFKIPDQTWGGKALKRVRDLTIYSVMSGRPGREDSAPAGNKNLDQGRSTGEDIPGRRMEASAENPWKPGPRPAAGPSRRATVTGPGDDLLKADARGASRKKKAARSRRATADAPGAVHLDADAKGALPKEAVPGRRRATGTSSEGHRLNTDARGESRKKPPAGGRRATLTLVTSPDDFGMKPDAIDASQKEMAAGRRRATMNEPEGVKVVPKASMVWQKADEIERSRKGRRRATVAAFVGQYSGNSGKEQIPRVIEPEEQIMKDGYGETKDESDKDMFSDMSESEPSANDNCDESENGDENSRLSSPVEPEEEHKKGKKKSKSKAKKKKRADLNDQIGLEKKAKKKQKKKKKKTQLALIDPETLLT